MHVLNVPPSQYIVRRPLLKSVTSISLCQPCLLFVLPPFHPHFHSCALKSTSAWTDCSVLISHQDSVENGRATLYCVSADKLIVSGFIAFVLGLCYSVQTGLFQLEKWTWFPFSSASLLGFYIKFLSPSLQVVSSISLTSHDFLSFCGLAYISLTDWTHCMIRFASVWS